MTPSYDFEKVDDSILEALTLYHDGTDVALADSQLAQNALIHLYFLASEMPKQQNKGQAVRSLLHWAIDQLKPRGEADWLAPSWRAYIILYHFYLQRMPLTTLAEKMRVAVSTIEVWRKQALEALTQVLHQALSDSSLSQTWREYALVNHYTNRSPDEQHLLSFFAIFRQPLVPVALYQLASQAAIPSPHTLVSPLVLAHLLILSEAQTKITIHPEMQAYLLTQIPWPKAKTWHQIAASYYQSQGNYLEMAYHTYCLEDYNQAAHILLDNAQAILAHTQGEALPAFLSLFDKHLLSDPDLWESLTKLLRQLDE